MIIPQANVPPRKLRRTISAMKIDAVTHAAMAQPDSTVSPDSAGATGLAGRQYVQLRVPALRHRMPALRHEAWSSRPLAASVVAPPRARSCGSRHSFTARCVKGCPEAREHSEPCRFLLGQQAFGLQEGGEGSAGEIRPFEATS